jgi:hypothetical protein
LLFPSPVTIRYRAFCCKEAGSARRDIQRPYTKDQNPHIKAAERSSAAGIGVKRRPFEPFKQTFKNIAKMLFFRLFVQALEF